MKRFTNSIGPWKRYFALAAMLLGTALFSFSSADAAYRVYQYVIRSSENPALPLAYLDTSTLPPVAYQAYHGSNLIEVELLRSWPCPGDTGRRPFCEAPGDQLLNDLTTSISSPASPLPGSSYEN